ncbi:MAG: hypothetical protein GY722_25135 [bacterium]|nr:hypothetical protein [bacterium]
MTEATPPEDVLLPLRDRMPDYLATFGILWAAIVATGLAVALFTSASVVEGVGFIALAVAVGLMLAGGASGGGYTSLGLGAAGAMLGGRQRHDEDYEDADVRRGRLKRVNTEQRLRRGLRPEKNPRAFWQVIAGLVTFAIAMALLMLFGG